MNEYLQQFIFSLQIVWLAVFAFLYGCGGIHNNWVRRYLASVWMMLGIFFFSTLQGTWSLWYLTFLPLAIGATLIGYGKGAWWQRFIRRVLQGMAFAVSPAALAIINRAWWPWTYDFILCLTATIFIGEFNIFPNPRKNETLIATICFVLVLFMVSKP